MAGILPHPLAVRAKSTPTGERFVEALPSRPYKRPAREGRLPADAPSDEQDRWKLPDTPMQVG